MFFIPCILAKKTTSKTGNFKLQAGTLPAHYLGAIIGGHSRLRLLKWEEIIANPRRRGWDWFQSYAWICKRNQRTCTWIKLMFFVYIKILLGRLTPRINCLQSEVYFSAMAKLINWKGLNWIWFDINSVSWETTNSHHHLSTFWSLQSSLILATCTAWM